MIRAYDINHDNEAIVKTANGEFIAHLPQTGDDEWATVVTKIPPHYLVSNEDNYLWLSNSGGSWGSWNYKIDSMALEIRYIENGIESNTVSGGWDPFDDHNTVESFDEYHTVPQQNFDVLFNPSDACIYPIQEIKAVRITLALQDMDFEEASLKINGTEACYIPHTTGNGVELIEFSIPSEYLGEIATNSSNNLKIESPDGSSTDFKIHQFGMTFDYTINTGSPPSTTGEIMPEVGASNVPLNTNIVFGFNKPMDPSTINNNTIIVYDQSNNTYPSSNISYNPETYQVIYDPDDDFPGLETIQINVKTGIKDTWGNSLSSEEHWGFTTREAPDETPPELISHNPVDGATDVSHYTTIEMTFSEPLNEAQIDESTVEVTGDQSTGDYNVKRSWDKTTNTLTLMPFSYYESYENVTVSIFEGIEDLAGNDLSPTSFSFQIEDLSAPDIPEGLTASPSDRSVALSWVANDESDIEGYNVYRRSTGEDYYKVNSSPIISINYTVSGLDNFKDYYFKVSAVDNNSNESRLSNSIKAVPYKYGPNYISGTWTTNHTLKSEGGVYVVDGGLTIDPNAKLDIEEGVVIKFKSGDNLEINGEMNTYGTTDNKIVFTSFKDDEYGGDTNNDGQLSTPSRGDWDQIRIENSETTIENCLFRYADEAVYVYAHNRYGNITVDPVIKNSEFEHNNEGVYIYGDRYNDYYGLAKPSLINNSFSNNEFPVSLSGIAMPSYQNNTFSNNDIKGIGVSAYGNHIFYPNDTIVWKNIGLPYVPVNDITLDENTTLAIEKGQIIKFQSFDGFNIPSTANLDLQATTDSMIVFTSLEDDEYGGDSNNDGQLSTPSRGDWDNLFIESDNVNLQHCNILYADEGIWVENSSPTIQDCYIAHCNSSGIRLEESGSNPDIMNNEIVKHENYGINNYSGPQITAENNWWGHSSGPYHPTLNPSGEGSEVSDNVDFDPWSTHLIFSVYRTNTITNANITEDEGSVLWVEDLNNYFDDPDDATLSFTARSFENKIIPEVNSSSLNLKTRDNEFGLDSVIVEATNGRSIARDTFKVNINGVNDPPYFSSNLDTIVKEDALLKYTILVNDPDGDTCEISAKTLPYWLAVTNQTTNSIELEGTPDFGEIGDHTVVLYATDNIISSPIEVTFTVSVASVNDNPVFTSTPITTAGEDIKYEYKITTFDEEGQRVRINPVNIPAWCNFSEIDDTSALLSGIPTEEDIGTYGVEIQISDGITTDNILQSFSLSVKNAPDVVSVSPDSSATDVFLNQPLLI
ncbi:MAG TPA: Ig-like domain-containing protein, partial [bacterium]|nr:Ig-like domain-containing protein [bacterium]